jgi:hypothetical protein
MAQNLGLTHSGAVRLSDRLEAAGLARRASAGAAFGALRLASSKQRNGHDVALRASSSS